MADLWFIRGGVGDGDAPRRGAPRAEEPAVPDRPPAVKITLYPAASPVPALRYQLLPAFEERRPGNAAVLYGKVKAEEDPFFRQFATLEQDHAEWWSGPLDRFPLEEVRKVFVPPLYFLKLAAHCETCDWDIPIREEKFFTILLPENPADSHFRQDAGAAGAGFTSPRTNTTAQSKPYRRVTRWGGTSATIRR